MAYENRDYTHLSEEEKQKIELIAQAIRNKVYGIDVRESIALAIEWINREYKLAIKNNELTLREFENAKASLLNTLSPTVQAMTELNSLNSHNVLARIFDGTEVFLTEGAGTSYSFEPYVNGILNVNYQLRFNYVSGSSYLLTTRTIPVEYTSGYKFGTWIRKYNIQNMGEKLLYFGLEQATTVHKTALLSKEDLLKVGSTFTNNEGGTQTTLTVEAEYGGWMYVAVEIESIGFTDGKFRLGIFTNINDGDGKLDFLNLTLLDTNDNILPYHIYPDNYKNNITYPSKDDIVEGLKTQAEQINSIEYINSQYNNSFENFVYEQDKEKVNKVTGFDDGITIMLEKGTSTQKDFEWHDNPKPLPYPKYLRMFYTDGNVDNLSHKIADYEINDGRALSFGAWIRKSDIEALGNTRFYMGVNTNVLSDGTKTVQTPLLYSHEISSVGYKGSTSKDNVNLSLHVTEEYDGWLYFNAIMDAEDSDTLTSYQPYIAVTMTGGTGKLDIANFQSVLTGNKLLPFYSYPKETTKIYTDKELSEKIESLDAEAGATEFVGRKGALIGDSITVPTDGYAQHIQSILGCDTIDIFAIGGRPMSNGTANGDGAVTYGKVWNGATIDWAQYDFVIILCGTNDFKLNAPLGNIGNIGDGDFDELSFYGAYRSLLEHILTLNNEIQINLVTALQRDNDSYDVNYTNSSGHKLIDYVTATKEVGGLYGIPVYDAYHNAQVTKLTLNTYTRDGLHLNGAGLQSGNGYKMVGRKIGKFVKQNMVMI